MANNSMGALNAAVGTSAMENAATNVAANVNTNASALDPTFNNGEAGQSAWIADFCDDYGDWLLRFAVAFLAAALVLAIASAVIALLQATRASDGDRQVRADAIPDPAKFVDALKGLVEALAKAPAWFALFLGGALLLWMASSLASDVCAPADPARNKAANSTNKQEWVSGRRASNTRVDMGNSANANVSEKDTTR